MTCRAGRAKRRGNEARSNAAARIAPAALGGTPIATIRNSENPEQEVGLFYLREEAAFVTRGIGTHFGLREILVPVHFVVAEFDLVGAIISAILERISSAHERDSSFVYEPQFQVMGREFTLTEYGEYIRLEEEYSPS
ncbi:MAG: hypothetical protein JRJ16_04065 [Deltaproteobacteria bacterium]|nr:hypothetical protein [Deltaproteobacteria bacterium]